MLPLPPSPITIGSPNPSVPAGASHAVRPAARAAGKRDNQEHPSFDESIAQAAPAEEQREGIAPRKEFASDQRAGESGDAPHPEAQEATQESAESEENAAADFPQLFSWEQPFTLIPSVIAAPEALPEEAALPIGSVMMPSMPAARDAGLLLLQDVGLESVALPGLETSAPADSDLAGVLGIIPDAEIPLPAASLTILAEAKPEEAVSVIAPLLRGGDALPGSEMPQPKMTPALSVPERIMEAATMPAETNLVPMETADLPPLPEWRMAQPPQALPQKLPAELSVIQAAPAEEELPVFSEEFNPHRSHSREDGLSIQMLSGEESEQGADAHDSPPEQHEPPNMLAPSSAAAGASAKADTRETEFARMLHQPPRIPASEQVTFHIRTAMQQGGGSRIIVQLEPVELGRVEIRIEVSSEGKAGVMIIADNRMALDMLQRDARGLERTLNGLGLQTDSGSLSFNLRGEQQQPSPQHAAGYLVNQRLAEGEAEEDLLARQHQGVILLHHAQGVDIHV